MNITALRCFASHSREDMASMLLRATALAGRRSIRLCSAFRLKSPILRRKSQSSAPMPMENEAKARRLRPSSVG